MYYYHIYYYWNIYCDRVVEQNIATEHLEFCSDLERLTVRNPTFCLWILSSLFTYLLPKYSASYKTYVIKESLDEAW